MKWQGRAVIVTEVKTSAVFWHTPLPISSSLFLKKVHILKDILTLVITTSTGCKSSTLSSLRLYYLISLLCTCFCFICSSATTPLQHWVAAYTSSGVTSQTSKSGSGFTSSIFCRWNLSVCPIWLFQPWLALCQLLSSRIDQLDRKESWKKWTISVVSSLLTFSSIHFTFFILTLLITNHNNRCLTTLYIVK